MFNQQKRQKRSAASPKKKARTLSCPVVAKDTRVTIDDGSKTNVCGVVAQSA
ncbi:hypothetical protein Tcan_02853 [Toxocara canis]|uniref:Uncharacterized protein n=1 Tax=Toxocara canis TaxID=6265 RepID=A0A0B2VA69_TOXCA|nr:hypothetical protein Tcan_02853 [Toxocara canis]